MRFFTSCVFLVGALAAVSCAPTEEVPKYDIYTMKEVINGNVEKLEYLGQIMQLESTYPRETKNELERAMISAEPAVQVATDLNMLLTCSPGVGFAYMKMFGEHSDDTHYPMPPPLKRYMSALGYEISAICKTSLVESLKKVASDVTESELAPVAELEKRGAMLIGESASGFKQTDVLRIFVELYNFILEGSVNENLVLDVEKLKPETRKHLKLVSSSCEVYRPYYRQLLETLIRLSNLGFDYNMNQPLTAEIREAFNANSDVRRWLNIMLVCEAVSDPLLFKPSPQDPSKRRNIKESSFPSIPLQDRLMVDQKRMSEMSMFRDESAKEAQEWFGNLYGQLTDEFSEPLQKDPVNELIQGAIRMRLTGEKRRLADEAAQAEEDKKDPEQFWLSYIKFIDSKF